LNEVILLAKKCLSMTKMSVCTNVDGHALAFQFSFSSVAYSQVSLSVRTAVRLKLTDKRHTHRSGIGGNHSNGKKFALNFTSEGNWAGQHLVLKVSISPRRDEALTRRTLSSI
jgi:hypothetical protein